MVDRALSQGQALSYRFLRRERKCGPAWYVQVTLEREDPPAVTSRLLGALGADLDPGLVVAARIHRCGNPVSGRHLRLPGRKARPEYGLSPLPGCDPPALTVGSAVRPAS